MFTRIIDWWRDRFCVDARIKILRDDIAMLKNMRHVDYVSHQRRELRLVKEKENLAAHTTKLTETLVERDKEINTLIRQVAKWETKYQRLKKAIDSQVTIDDTAESERGLQL